MAQPLPVIPLAQSPLRYSVKARRPDLLTTIAALSITFGAAGLGWSAFALYQTIQTEGIPIPGGDPMIISATSLVSTGASTTSIQWKVKPGVIWLELADAAVGIALALVLLVMGFLTLAGSPLSRPGHMLWARVKLPVALLSCAIWVLSLWAGSYPVPGLTTIVSGSGQPAQGLPLASIMWRGCILGAIMLIYPITVLIVMRNRQVKGYYNAGAGRAAGGVACGGSRKLNPG
jgi:hypothetical protein